MRIVKAVLLGAVAVLLCGGWGLRAYAHELVRDQNGGGAAILHITPDDDPIAGKAVSLSFDIEDQALTEERDVYTFTVQNEAGDIVQLPVAVQGSVAAANYTFPAQGRYTLQLTIQPKAAGKAVIFNYSQSVSRGTRAASPPPPAWVKPIFLGSGVLFLVLCGVAFSKRRAIATYSVLQRK